MKRLMVIALVIFLMSCASASRVEQQGRPLGTFENPVRCDMPRGERAYLNRLRCKDGATPIYERMGSYGRGPYGNILDGYEVKCGDQGFEIFMDMYHTGFVETNTVPGFSIIE